ncbi:ImmA/IrrE family metallo-endopeptidase [Cryobacterium sp. 10I1]|uniref:ImmA/IrrE family metallo-endopeptidase n=1 Tax=unclassified Cryobacterium TaxID=2649013 RepID=UPI002AC89DA4|nr:MULTISPECIES: ImmA/IrrE family metallo-endopeptidase [unclassified Cryobacterium]MEB0003697.1 ImmA/IrrE family metallo-endopeptidase [Cryobacterium sp. RTC2.1]MEB0286854.1 ImmA/IrrE family metallo-endopeptidase [Cryobacterium sp. 10S3]MEB0304152.1 ImmA/IrrE family metallo-endopeptidase [Cryobacterium sp. 10I1]WPX13464.1 ImmA/IrrE family metallo-endopeptidase [Cryobacterium sp. 10S3]
MSTRFISPTAIENLAARMRDEAGLLGESSSRVDIRRMAVFFGCEVQDVEFSPDTVSARVKRHDDSARFQYLIQINASDAKPRRRFSIAHELAHVALHDDQRGGTFDFVEDRKPLADYRDPNDLYKEVQANMLAAALLMPRKDVERVWEDVDDIDDLANAFAVSRDSAYFRLNNLGLLVNG